MNPLSKDAGVSGFTIIEVLVALALLAVLLSVFTSSLTGTVKITSDSQRQLSNTSKVQQILESIKGDWKDTTQYADACATTLKNLPEGFAASDIQIYNLDSRGNTLSKTGGKSNTPVLVGLARASCVADENSKISADTTNPIGTVIGNGVIAGSPPPMRRIIVSKNSIVLAQLDVLAP